MIMDFNRFALSQQLGRVCHNKGVRLALAESCTGGAISEVITAVSGSSGWFNGGIIAYTNAAKIALLGVDALLIEKYGAVSEPVARVMALSALERLSADVAFSITGIAGPSGGSLEKPVGTVCFGLADKHKDICETRAAFFYSGRKHIRRCASYFALKWLLEHIQSG